MLSNIVMVFSFASAMLIAAVFAHAGLSKLARDNRDYYQSVLSGYGLTLKPWSPYLIWFIGSFELLIAILTFISFTQMLGLVLAVVMMTAYTLMFIKQLYQGKADIDCGCAGPGGGLKIGLGLVLRNTVLIIASIVAIINVPVINSDIYFLGMPLAIALILIYSSIEQLTTNNQKVQAIRNSKY